MAGGRVCVGVDSKRITGQREGREHHYEWGEEETSPDSQPSHRSALCSMTGMVPFLWKRGKREELRQRGQAEARKWEGPGRCKEEGAASGRRKLRKGR